MIIRILTWLALLCLFVLLGQKPVQLPVLIKGKIIPEKSVSVKEKTKIKEKDSRNKSIVLYKASWKGVNIASMRVEVYPNENYSDMKVSISTHGLLKWIVKYRSETDGKIGYKDGEYVPSFYHTDYSYRKKHRDIKLTYSQDGKQIIKDENVPPEKRWKRKEVPQQDKDGSLDPLALALVAREKIKQAYLGQGDKQFSLPLYDGRRRSDQVFSVSDGLKGGLIQVQMEERPVSGYTNNELKIFKDGSQIIDIYVEPKEFIPQKAKGQSPLGEAWIYLKKMCQTVAECS